MTYHRVANSPGNRLAVAPSLFSRQMRYLRDAGYEVMSLDDVVSRLADGETFHEKTVAITFDDGFLDNYTNAFPVLREYRFPATIFLATNYISGSRNGVRKRFGSDNEPMLNWHEIRAMNRHGITFGAHTGCHCDLTKVSPETAEKEILTSKEKAEKEIGKSVCFFCYPDGRFNGTILDIVDRAGYRGACSVIPGVNGDDTDLLALKRTEISGHDSLFDFKKKLRGAYDPLHKFLQKHRGRNEITIKERLGKSRRRKIRILHVIDSLVAEGAEQLLLDILSEADRERFEYAVCCLVSGGPLVREMRDMGIPVVIIGRRRKVDFRALLRLIAHVRNYDPEIIHTHLFTSSLYGRIAGTVCRRKTVVTEHNTSAWKRWYHRLANRLLARVTARIIAVSETVRDSLIERDKVPAKKIAVVRNGVCLSRLTSSGDRGETRREFNCSEDDILAVTVAALTEQKGHTYLIDSAKRFVREKRNVMMACVGEGPLRHKLERQVNATGLRDRIIFTGSRRDIREILDAADVFVLPSLYEGLSVSLMEAAAMGKPIVATAIGSNSELIRSGETGLLVNARAPSQLADAIQYCIDNPGHASEMGRKAAEHVRANFSVRRTARQYEEIYRELVD